jgi:hypothetical protein
MNRYKYILLLIITCSFVNAWAYSRAACYNNIGSVYFGQCYGCYKQSNASVWIEVGAVDSGTGSCFTKYGESDCTENTATSTSNKSIRDSCSNYLRLSY